MDFLDLAKFEDIWQQEASSDNEKTYEEISAGIYKVKIEDVELKNTESSGKPCFVWKFKILSIGKYTGRLLWKTSMLVSEENIKWFKKDLEKCKLFLTSPTELPEKCTELIGKTLKITLKHNGNFSNIYINQLILDDDIPFDSFPNSASITETKDKANASLQQEVPF